MSIFDSVLLTYVYIFRTRASVLEIGISCCLLHLFSLADLIFKYLVVAVCRWSVLESASLQQHTEEFYSPKQRHHCSPRENWIRLERKAAKVLILLLESRISRPKSDSHASGIIWKT